MRWHYHTSYPGINDLIKKARQKIPPFAFEYLEGGCNEDVNLYKNTHELRRVELKPLYLARHSPPSLETELFGHTYDAPFGVSPIGLQGLIWPGSAEILAKAASQHNIPFILSTVTTASIENIAEITEGKAWYQLYHPADVSLRDGILQRCDASGYTVLVLLCDVPSFGFRPKDIRNGLSMPPRMTFKNILQILSRPEWTLRTMLHGKPEFATMKRYMPSRMNMKQLGIYMNQTFSGRLSEERIKPIRDQWKGKIVLKGVACIEDAEMALRLGLDGIIVSNHGGRQLDAAEAAIRSLQKISPVYKGKIKVMMDSGVRSGVDVARTVACGADFTFLGRTFMYSVAALGKKGGNHAIALLKTQLQQVMEQVNCENTTTLYKHLME